MELSKVLKYITMCLELPVGTRIFQHSSTISLTGNISPYVGSNSELLVHPGHPGILALRFAQKELEAKLLREILRENPKNFMIFRPGRVSCNFSDLSLNDPKSIPMTNNFLSP